MAYQKQNFKTGTVLDAEHLNKIENGIVAVEQQIPANISNYWAGKKFVMNGDSIPYGSALSSISNAYPYLVAKQLGMNLTNYAIGGSVIAKRTGDYDECYFNTAKWTEDKYFV